MKQLALEMESGFGVKRKLAVEIAVDMAGVTFWKR